MQHDKTVLAQYAALARRIEEAEQRDPQLRELKEHVRAAVAWVNRAADDDEMSQALRAENQAIEALVLYIFQ